MKPEHQKSCGYEDIDVGEPAAGQVRLRHVAACLNYADTYFRDGTYQISIVKWHGG